MLANNNNNKQCFLRVWPKYATTRMISGLVTRANSFKFFYIKTCTEHISGEWYV